ncbi:MAG: hypothetical protein ACK5K7_02380 [Bacilli bacterium]
MIFQKEDSIHYVYGLFKLYIEDEVRTFIYTKDGFNIVNSKYTEELIVNSENIFITKFYLSDNAYVECISESKYLDASYYNFEYGTNFSSEQEKTEFEEKMKKFEKELPEINQRIDIDYIRWKVKNGQIEEWQNNFTDKIVELSDTERFIDDDNYDIFYDINDLDNIKVVKKAS